MTALQKTLIILIATVSTAVGTSIYEAHRASEQLASLRVQIEVLRLDQKQVTNRFAALLKENELLRLNGPELLRMRNGISRLRAKKTASVENTPAYSAALSWWGDVDRLKVRLEGMPELKIPELQFVSDNDWLTAVKQTYESCMGVHTDQSIHYVFALLRKTAKHRFARMLSDALCLFAEANKNQVPGDMLDLNPYLIAPVSEAMLQRYKLVQSGDLNRDQPAIEEKEPVDASNDCLFRIGASGEWFSGPGLVGAQGGHSARTTVPARPPQSSPTTSATPAPQENVDARGADTHLEDQKRVAQILAAFSDANQGSIPENPSELAPYLKTSEDKAALERFLKNNPEN